MFFISTKINGQFATRTYGSHDVKPEIDASLLF